MNAYRSYFVVMNNIRELAIVQVSEDERSIDVDNLQDGTQHEDLGKCIIYGRHGLLKEKCMFCIDDDNALMIPLPTVAELHLGEWDFSHLGRCKECGNIDVLNTIC